MKLRSRHIVLALAAVALALLLAFHSVWLQAAGDFLVVHDPLQSSDVIVVLGGSSPARAQHAV